MRRIESRRLEGKGSCLDSAGVCKREVQRWQCAGTPAEYSLQKDGSLISDFDLVTFPILRLSPISLAKDLVRMRKRLRYQCALLPFPLKPNNLIALPPRTFSLFSSDKLDIFLITSTVRGQVATASPWSKSLPMMML